MVALPSAPSTWKAAIWSLTTPNQIAQRMHNAYCLDGGGGQLPVRTQLLEMTRRDHRGGRLVRPGRSAVIPRPLG